MAASQLSTAMPDDPTTPRTRWPGWAWLLTLAAAGALLLPLAVFVFGQTFMGPYEGEGGVIRFLAGVLGDAARGGPAGLTLVFTPAALLLLWWLVIRLLRRPAASAEE